VRKPLSVENSARLILKMFRLLNHRGNASLRVPEIAHEFVKMSGQSRQAFFEAVALAENRKWLVTRDKSIRLTELGISNA
jgi:hypothetical protein